ncbi:MAG: peroxiredoxin [Candidatus Melainabacteria bacterium]|jgi:peroxiredoxin (alkyl hydroperoxide reductase subunit C)|nr:peroxiredoxin [Candidatus Melainabacteria bacterium]NBV99109.1 peroxiredoxin [Pseudomonadota bacterium]
MGVLVGKQAPEFTAPAVVNGTEFKEIKLSDFKGKKYVVLFFYPLDFTFVCPTELHAFQAKLAEFNSLDTEVIGVSVDSKFSHAAWLNTDKSEGGIKGVKYAVVSDLKKEITTAYDVLEPNMGVAYRGLFLIDKNGIVQHQVVNNLPLGRNIDEAIRMVKALQFFEKNGEVCPANWNEGAKGMKPNEDGLKEFFSKEAALA